MGNICDCLKGTNVEQEYTPIETVEVSRPDGRTVEKKSGNNYQSIIDRASGNFISSTYRSKSDGIAINNQGDSDLIRTKFNSAEINPSVINSPPTTGIVLQAYSTFAPPNNKSSSSTNAPIGGGSSSSSAPAQSPTSVVSFLHKRPAENPTLEKSADELAAIVVKQNDKNIDKFSNSSNEYSAVVGFKPFEGSIHSR